eukprot:gnl/TRDRNA2_/TRDRNA2_83683_c0_seq1.p1 gnl/TRDRNA2_/TRDRNA2_83683_c0~~gnl/TRDRNA2_/TRDRNA2_83683_c0_seq1.p1  ORF type:complete len:341 (+),score=29.44 gnl/TRDRNA2_/TRDRNA2_83683_c0_seq1:72-1025(+)
MAGAGRAYAEEAAAGDWQHAPLFVTTTGPGRPSAASVLEVRQIGTPGSTWPVSRTSADSMLSTTGPVQPIEAPPVNSWWSPHRTLSRSSRSWSGGFDPSRSCGSPSAMSHSMSATSTSNCWTGGSRFADTTWDGPRESPPSAEETLPEAVFSRRGSDELSSSWSPSRRRHRTQWDLDFTEGPRVELARAGYKTQTPCMWGHPLIPPEPGSRASSPWWEWQKSPAGVTTLDLDQPATSKYVGYTRYHGAPKPWQPPGTQLPPSHGRETAMVLFGKFGVPHSKSGKFTADAFYNASKQSHLPDLRRISRNSSNQIKRTH